MKVSRGSLLGFEKNYPVINSNTSNFCSPNRFKGSHINRINPDKSTFLNSNLIVSNILNHLSPTRCPDPGDPTDAYTNKDTELIKKKQFDQEYKDKLERVRNKAKCTGQTVSDQFKDKEKQLLRQIQQIQIMRIEMNQKSRDIMGRKEDTAYLGRNIFLQGDKFLKQMKEHNPTDKTIKSEATRMLMKECAKKKSRTAIKIQINNSVDVSDIAGSNNGSTLNASMEASIDAFARNQLKASQFQKEKTLMKLIRNKSYDSVLLQQKRNAAWKSFSNNWAMGFYKNQDIITTKKKRKNKRSPRKYVCASQNNNSGILEYNDIFSRHMSLKKYKENFNSTASSYSLTCLP